MLIKNVYSRNIMARKLTKPLNPYHLLLNISIILFVHIQSAESQDTSTLTTTAAATTTTPAPTLSDGPKPEVEALDSSNSTNSSILISGDEFVDFTEAPVILFDGTSEEGNKSENAAPTATTSSPPPSKTSTTTSTTEAPTISEPEESTTSSETETTPSSGEETEDEPETDDSSEGIKLNEDFKPPQNVSQYMDYIEHLFHDLRHQITDLFEPHLPQLIRTSQLVQLSGSCSYDMLRMALALRQFEPWALRMIDSSGKVPEGIFEGSFTALGSYDECLNTIFGVSSPGEQSTGGVSTPAPPTSNARPTSDRESASDQQPQQQPSTRGKYCLVNVSPFLPPKPPADRVERLFQEEANRRNYTKDDQFSRLSPMFYYMRFRIGVCVPSTCLESDMHSISEALSSSLKLNITVANCQVKQTTPLTNHQLVGGCIFGLVVLLVLGATVIDCYRRKRKQVGADQQVVMFRVVVRDPKLGGGGGGKLENGIPIVYRTHGNHNETPNTNELLQKHWSWMSFSLVANFKLYFEGPPRSSVATPSRLIGDGSRESPRTPMIKCLNGIRVLSLCWVIVANSYITLDPRATKRLTKTREAPKDFLFQMVVQASLAIETFFFLSGVLMSLSFANRLKPAASKNGNLKLKDGSQKRADSKDTPKRSSYLMQWLRFYIHRYVRMTPATMLVIAFSMFAYRYGDGPLWSEATEKAHQSCSLNWWRHLLHVANFIDTRQMCFIHYWYIAADMQLFLFAPVLMFLIYKRRRIGYAIVTTIGLASIVSIFYTTYARNLPPTLLFYNSDPESRREFGNTIMTKPLTHVLPYMVGMLLGKRIHESIMCSSSHSDDHPIGHKSLTAFLGSTAAMIALVEVFLPYKWNNSHLPTRFLAAVYAALFRFAWSLALAYLVLSCRHERSSKCRDEATKRRENICAGCQSTLSPQLKQPLALNCPNNDGSDSTRAPTTNTTATFLCMCAHGGNLVNRFLGLNIFTHLSKLSFVAYLIHLPLMSVFVGQTRGLFAFSHTLVIHLALSYLVMTFILSFVLVHIIEFPFITFERYLFSQLLSATPNSSTSDDGDGVSDDNDAKLKTMRATSDNYGNQFNVVKFSNGATGHQDKFNELEAANCHLHHRHGQIGQHDRHGATKSNGQHRFDERL